MTPTLPEVNEESETLLNSVVGVPAFVAFAVMLWFAYVTSTVTDAALVAYVPYVAIVDTMPFTFFFNRTVPVVPPGNSTK